MVGDEARARTIHRAALASPPGINSPERLKPNSGVTTRYLMMLLPCSIVVTTRRTVCRASWSMSRPRPEIAVTTQPGKPRPGLAGCFELGKALLDATCVIEKAIGYLRREAEQLPITV